MAKDSVVLSPEYVNVGRGEAAVTGGPILVGQLLSISGGLVSPATAVVAAVPRMVSVENIAVASELDYSYSDTENCFFQYLPSGVRVNLKADAATYNAGDELEVGASGLLAAKSAGITVAVVPPDGGEVISAGGSLMVILV